ncbi:toxin Cry1Ac domain D-VI-related protein [Enterococcus hirae]|nr:toxin Cry1Ac domain D-VI-related protein [Enterococcus hirae]
MNYKKTIAVMMLSTTMLGTVGSITAHAGTTGQLPVAQQADQNQAVNIPDANLKKALNETLGQAPDAQITADQLATIKELGVNNKEIQSIEGLQYCSNLEKLYIGNPMMVHDESNTISDITPLKDLKKLVSLQMGTLRISDFTPLKNKTFKRDFLHMSQLGDQQKFMKKTIIENTPLTIENPYKDIDGSPMKPTSIPYGGVYNESENTITWSFESAKKMEGNMAGNLISFQGKSADEQPELVNTVDEMDGIMTRIDLSVNIISQEQVDNDQLAKEVTALFVNNDPSTKKLAKGVTKEYIMDLMDKVFALDETAKFSDGLTKNKVWDWTFEAYRVYDEQLLFKDENTLADGVTKETIDQVKKEAEQLQDSEQKTKLLEMIAKAQQLLDQKQAVTQTIGFEGQTIAGKADFARVSLVVKDHKATVIKNSNYQFHWDGWKSSKYASIKLTDPNGKVLYEKSWRGNQQVEGNYGTIAQCDLPEGSSVEVYHAEGPWHRLSTNDNEELKTKLGKTGYTYTYKVKNNQLVLTNVQ